MQHIIKLHLLVCSTQQFATVLRNFGEYMQPLNTTHSEILTTDVWKTREMHFVQVPRLIKICSPALCHYKRVSL
uniref:Putative secreted protein n=1 Tax=Rhipicephalus microplus TaxID=6941 RepID=A0A6M2DAW2_RHIMP